MYAIMPCCPAKRTSVLLACVRIRIRRRTERQAALQMCSAVQRVRYGWERGPGRGLLQAQDAPLPWPGCREEELRRQYETVQHMHAEVQRRLDAETEHHTHVVSVDMADRWAGGNVSESCVGPLCSHAGCSPQGQQASITVVKPLSDVSLGEDFCLDMNWAGLPVCLKHMRLCARGVP
jgi:hypothetical protein